MEIEIINLNESSRQEFQAKLKQYRRDYNEMRVKVERTEENYIDQKNKETLMGSGTAIEMKVNPHEKLLNSGQMLSNQNYKLKEGLKTAYECEKTAENTLNELHRNSDTMENIKGKNKEIYSEYSSSNNLLNIMTKRIFWRKVTMYILFFILLAGGIGLTVVILNKNKK